MSLQPPQEVSNGTATYIMLTLFAIICLWVARFIGKLSKDEAQIGTVVAITTGVSAWLFWLCAWMHQWHPLITPEWMSD